VDRIGSGLQCESVRAKNEVDARGPSSPDMTHRNTVIPATTTSHEATDAGAGDRSSPRGRIDATAVLWMAMAVLGLGAFAVLTVAMLNHFATPLDQTLLADARAWQGYATLWRIISESANIPLIVIGVGLVLFLWFTRRRREAVLVAGVLIAVTAGSEAVKQLVARPRPSGTDPNIPGVVYSYPSGHVLEALTIFGMLAIRVVRSRAARIVAGLVVVAVLVEVVLVGIARVALSAHYPTDVLAGWFGGSGMLGVYGFFTHRRRPGDESPGDERNAASGGAIKRPA
jgi:membrane-associated phospholipid phosphatase